MRYRTQTGTLLPRYRHAHSHTANKLQPKQTHVSTTSPARTGERQARAAPPLHDVSMYRKFIFRFDKAKLCVQSISKSSIFDTTRNNKKTRHITATLQQSRYIHTGNIYHTPRQLLQPRGANDKRAQPRPDPLLALLQNPSRGHVQPKLMVHRDERLKRIRVGAVGFARFGGISRSTTAASGTASSTAGTVTVTTSRCFRSGSSLKGVPHTRNRNRAHSIQRTHSRNRDGQGCD